MGSHANEVNKTLIVTLPTGFTYHQHIHYIILYISGTHTQVRLADYLQIVDLVAISMFHVQKPARIVTSHVETHSVILIQVRQRPILVYCI
jgi:hypothetical protein